MDVPLPMKTSIDHLPPIKQHELRRVVRIILEEFDDALKGGLSSAKKRGRILKIILFGSYARGSFVDEPNSGKGYRSDFDLLVVVNNRQFTDFAVYWNKAADRLMRDPEISTPVSVIAHSLREVNTALRDGRYFFVDIRRDGIAVYELDDEPLAESGNITREEAFRLALEYYGDRLPGASAFLDASVHLVAKKHYKHAAFILHQAVEQAYSTLLLVKTNYSPPSHNVKFLRGLVEGIAPELSSIWPDDQNRFVSWFNILNAAYVKARYSPHFEITEEALRWLIERTEALLAAIDQECQAQLDRMRP